MPKGPDPDISVIAQRLANVRWKIIILSGKGGVGEKLKYNGSRFSYGTLKLCYLTKVSVIHDHGNFVIVTSSKFGSRRPGRERDGPTAS